MNPLSLAPAAIAQPTPQELALSGSWTARGIGAIEPQLDALSAPSRSEMVVDGARIDALDTAGAWILQKLLWRLRDEGSAVQVRDLLPEFAKLLEVVGQQVDDQKDSPAPAVSAPPSVLESVGRSTEAAMKQAVAMLSFVGECAIALAGCFAHPVRFRWRPILYNIRSAGFDALPIVGLVSFLIGIVVS
jgi:phospholipid/cholesterol/gamma-HCH transport system permease protein